VITKEFDSCLHHTNHSLIIVAKASSLAQLLSLDHLLYRWFPLAFSVTGRPFRQASTGGRCLVLPAIEVELSDSRPVLPRSNDGVPVLPRSNDGVPVLPRSNDGVPDIQKSTRRMGGSNRLRATMEGEPSPLDPTCPYRRVCVL